MTDEVKNKKEHLWKPGESGNKRGRPKGTISSDKISEEDREYYGNDSRKFLERALLKARTWEEGLKYARELRALQHASLQSVQTKTDSTHTITLRWSKPEELASNEKSMVELSVDPSEVTKSISDLDFEDVSREEVGSDDNTEEKSSDVNKKKDTKG